jgi:hypothetical protein
MTRLLFATLLCALGTTQASAQTVVSQGLLELDDGAIYAPLMRRGSGSSAVFSVPAAVVNGNLPALRAILVQQLRTGVSQPVPAAFPGPC